MIWFFPILILILDVDIIDSEVISPFNEEDHDNVDEQEYEQEELKSFGFTKKGLKAKDEMEGINVKFD